MHVGSIGAQIVHGSPHICSMQGSGGGGQPGPMHGQVAGGETHFPWPSHADMPGWCGGQSGIPGGQGSQGSPQGFPSHGAWQIAGSATQLPLPSQAPIVSGDPQAGPASSRQGESMHSAPQGASLHTGGGSSLPRRTRVPQLADTARARSAAANGRRFTAQASR
jgi:hypothetical protein